MCEPLTLGNGPMNKIFCILFEHRHTRHGHTAYAGTDTHTHTLTRTHTVTLTHTHTHWHTTHRHSGRWPTYHDDHSTAHIDTQTHARPHIGPTHSHTHTHTHTDTHTGRAYGTWVVTGVPAECVCGFLLVLKWYYWAVAVLNVVSIYILHKLICWFNLSKASLVVLFFLCRFGWRILKFSRSVSSHCLPLKHELRRRRLCCFDRRQRESLTKWQRIL